MIKTQCAKCGKQYSLPDAAAGKKAKCKQCDAVIAIPPPDDDPLGLGGDTGGGSADLSALYGGSSQEPTAAPPSATQPVGFNPAVSFSNAPRRSSSGPPMKLILGGLGGLTALLLVVFVAVIVFSGGGDDEEPTTGPGLTAGAGGFTPELGSATDPNTGSGQTDPGGGGSDSSQGDAVAVEAPTEDQLSQWSFVLPADASRLVNRRVYRGLAFHVPSGWAYESSSVAAEMGADGSDPLFTDLFSESAKELGIIRIDPKDQVSLVVMVSRRDEPRDWPEAFRVDDITMEMVFGEQLLDTLEERATNGSDEEQFALGLMEGMMEAELDTPVGFAFAGPKAFYLRNDLVKDVAFGTLFGGYRFLRVTGESQDRKRMICYAGYIGDMQVVALAEAPRSQRAALADLDWVMRTAALATAEEASTQAAEDEVFSAWLNGGRMSIPVAGDPPPLPGLDPVAWEAPASGSLFANPLADMLIGPRGASYAMIPPASLDVVSKTRAAIRTKPADDGFWASMEVHKLSGFERRQPSPRSADGKLLVRGHPIDVPDDAELTELTSEYFTIHRLLHPEDDAGIRRVEYVMKDGAYLITVLGRFPADQPDRLEELDRAAMTVQPFDPDED